VKGFDGFSLVTVTVEVTVRADMMVMTEGAMLAGVVVSVSVVADVEDSKALRSARISVISKNTK